MSSVIVGVYTYITCVFSSACESSRAYVSHVYICIYTYICSMFTMMCIYIYIHTVYTI